MVRVTNSSGSRAILRANAYGRLNKASSHAPDAHLESNRARLRLGCSTGCSAGRKHDSCLPGGMALKFYNDAWVLFDRHSHPAGNTRAAVRGLDHQPSRRRASSTRMATTAGAAGQDCTSRRRRQQRTLPSHRRRATLCSNNSKAPRRLESPGPRHSDACRLPCRTIEKC